MRRIVPPPAADHFEGDYAPAGEATLTLAIGDLAIRFNGLPEELASQLRVRYDKFIGEKWHRHSYRSPA